MKYPYKAERRCTPAGWRDDWQVTEKSTGEFDSAWPTRQDARKEANRLNELASQQVTP